MGQYGFHLSSEAANSVSGLTLYACLQAELESPLSLNIVAINQAPLKEWRRAYQDSDWLEFISGPSLYAAL